MISLVMKKSVNNIVIDTFNMSSNRESVTFGINGQPISDNAPQLSSFIGRTVKSIVAPTYDTWKSVPRNLKDEVWKHVTDKYDILACYKPFILTRANISWKDWKSKLRTGTYDKYQTDTERKQKLPQYVKKEDWDRFVDIQLMPDCQAKRQRGKRARKEMKMPHTSGRKGQARVAEDLRKKFPDKEISRTDVFVETHTRKDGSATCEQLDKIKKTVMDDPSSAYNDLENDAVAQVLGLDTRGRVRGLGLGVSRTSMQHTHPYRIALREEQASRATMQTQMDKLKEMLEMRLAEEARQRKEDMERFFTSFSQGGSQVQTPSDCGSSFQPHPITTTQMGTSSCKLMHLTKRPACVVAYGRVKGDSPDDPGCYKIILDEIIEGNVDLVTGEGKMEDLITGDETEWPKWKTVFY